MPPNARHKNNAVAITSIIVAAVVFLVLITFLVFIPMFSTTQNTMTVQGSSTVKATPDLVAVYFNVQTNASTSSAANDANNAIYNQLKSSLISLGFNDSQIQTDSFSIYPNIVYDNTGHSTNLGYVAYHTVKLEFSASDSDKLSSVIDAGANSGAGISTIDFELSPSLQSQYKAQALGLASQDAKTKADAVAAGFGKSPGALVSVSVNDFNYMPFPVYAASGATGSAGVAEAKSAVTNITPSSQDVTADVSAVYKMV